MSTASMIGRMMLNASPIMRHRKRAEPPTLSDEQLSKLLDEQCAYPGDAAAKETRISEQNIQDIKIYLDCLDRKASRTGQAMWSHRPRTYAILRTINRVSLIDEFIKQGQNDFLLPWNQRTLPQCLFENEPDDKAREAFLRAQHFYLTRFSVKGVETEGKKHQNLGEGASGDHYFKKLRFLGQGGYGGVDEVRSCLSLKCYARKRVSRGRHNERNRRTQEVLIQELENLKLLTRTKAHRHLVSIIGSYTDPEYIAYLMLPVAKGNLEQFLGLEMSKETKARLRRFYGCLAGAIHHLHKNKFRHRDLKPRNILISGSEVYISDFGSAYNWAHSASGNTRHINTPVTREFMAPEIAKNEERGEPSDMWSLGAIYLEMTTTLLGRSVAQLKQHVRKYSQEHKTTSHYHDNLPALSEWLKKLSSVETGGHDNEPIAWTRDLIRRRPDERPTATELMKDMLESPSFTVFCCFKCHCDFHDVALAHDASAPKTNRKEDAAGTMDVVAQLLSPAGAAGNLSDSKTSGIDNWLVSCWAGVEARAGAELNVRTAGEAEAMSGAGSTFVSADPGDTGDEDFVDAVEYPPSSLDSSQDDSAFQEAEFSPQPEDNHYHSHAVLDEVWTRTYYEEDDDAGDFHTTALYPIADRPKDDATDLMQSSHSEYDSIAWGEKEPEDRTAVLNQPVYHGNVLDSGLGYFEFDDESSQAWGEISDRSDDSSEGGERPGLDSSSSTLSLEQREDRQDEPLPGFTVSTETDAMARHSFSVRFEEISDNSDTEEPFPPYEDLVGSASEMPAVLGDGVAVPSLPPIAREALDLDRALPAVVPLAALQQTDQVRAEIAAVGGNGDGSSVLMDAPEVLPGVSGAGDIKQPALPLRDPTIELQPPVAETSAPSVQTEERQILSPERPGSATSKRITPLRPAARLTTKLAPRGKKGVQFQPTPHPTTGNSTAGAEGPSANMPSFETYPLDERPVSQPSRLSKANMRALGKEQKSRVPRCPKKRDALLGVDPEKLMHDMVGMASVALSSRMTARTKLSHDALLFMMAPPGALEKSIIHACKGGKNTELKYLLGMDRSSGPASSKHRVALIRAVRGASQRHNNCVQTLIDTGINVDMVNYASGKTALHMALENSDFRGYTNLIMLLVDPACGGANPNRPDYNGDYPLTKIFSDSGSAPLEQHRLSALAIFLQHADIDVNVAVPGSNNTPLHLAVRRQDYRAVAMLLYKGADVNAKNSAGTTPLQVAANQFRGEMGSNHAEVLDLLLRYGAMVDERAGALGRTALHLAVASGTAHAVEVLLKYKASVTLGDTDGLDAMTLAVQHASRLTANEMRPEDDRLSDHVDMMQRLNDASQCEWPMKEGKCPVQIAIEDGDVVMLKKLLQHKLDPKARYLKGSIVDYAVKSGSHAVRALLPAQ